MTLVEWLNQQDIELCRWEYIEGDSATEHRHELVPLEPDEAETILSRYLKEVQ